MQQTTKMIRNYKDQSIYKNLSRSISGKNNKLVNLSHTFGIINNDDFFLFINKHHNILIIYVADIFSHHTFIIWLSQRYEIYIFHIFNTNKIIIHAYLDGYLNN